MPRRPAVLAPAGCVLEANLFGRLVWLARWRRVSRPGLDRFELSDDKGSDRRTCFFLQRELVLNGNSAQTRRSFSPRLPLIHELVGAATGSSGDRGSGGPTVALATIPTGRNRGRPARDGEVALKTAQGEASPPTILGGQPDRHADLRPRNATASFAAASVVELSLLWTAIRQARPLAHRLRRFPSQWAPAAISRRGGGAPGHAAPSGSASRL